MTSISSATSTPAVASTTTTNANDEASAAADAAQSASVAQTALLAGAAGAPSLLNQGGANALSGALDILDAARNSSFGASFHIGLSANARALTESALNQFASTGNALFSTGTVDPGSADGTEQTQTLILGLRAQFSTRQLSTQLQQAADPTATDDGGTAASSTVGTNVDTSA